MIYITKPFMPPKEEYIEYLEGIWSREWVTNNGPLVKELEDKVRGYLGTNDLLFVSNGTIALQLAIKAMKLKGEVVTTPFSYVATTSSIFWENCTPVFVDINPETLNIDEHKIEKAITTNTTAILATHVFGNVCAVEKIQEIAENHNLTVIYDAAHCFGVTYKGESVFNWGDISTASFHATKVFHTTEGGACVVNNSEVIQRLKYMRNFGHDGPSRFNGVGINGKNSEFHAAMGLVNLKYIDEILEKRKLQFMKYQNSFELLPIQTIKIVELEGYNFAYFPAIFDSEETALKVKEKLEEEDIYPRRYFYPSLSNLDYVEGDTPISDSISTRILCLPLYHTLTELDQQRVIRVITETIK